MVKQMETQMKSKPGDAKDFSYSAISAIPAKHYAYVTDVFAPQEILCTMLRHELVNFITRYLHLVILTFNEHCDLNVLPFQ